MSESNWRNDLESIMLSVLVIFNESELQENQEIKSLIQLAIGSWIMSISEPGGKKYIFVSHQQRGDNEYIGI